MRVALDTNILVYVEGVDDVVRKEQAASLIRALPPAETFVPAQVLGELFNVLTRKARWPPAQARVAVRSWHDTFPVIETSSTVLLSAADLCAARLLRIWDAIVLSAAAEADCSLLFSEDLQDGFIWRDVKVVNPFAVKRHKLLEELLGE
jgi:predicted nucleic acid-binding protein